MGGINMGGHGSAAEVRRWIHSRVKSSFNRYINRKARELLRDHLDGLESGPVFRGRAGERLSTRHTQRRFRQWRERAGISRAITCHGLRHSYAMRLYAKTGDIALVQRALGHRSITSTLVYASADEARLKVAVEA